MLVFGERGKLEYPEKNLLQQQREPTNSVHMRRRIGESNKGHSPLRHPCSQLMVTITSRSLDLQGVHLSVQCCMANLVMEEILEEAAISTTIHLPKWWFRYVDNSHTCLKRDPVNKFHQHLNSINRNIPFTLELENANGQGLPFLDTIITRCGTEIQVDVYGKPTHTDCYIS